MGSKCSLICAVVIIVLSATAAANCLGGDAGAALASTIKDSTNTTGGGASSEPAKRPDEKSSSVGAASPTVEVGQLLQGIGETTKWFSIILSVILAVFASLIGVVQIFLGLHLAKKEKQATAALTKNMKNKVDELRVNQKMLVNEAIEEYAGQFDRTILNEIQRITRRHMEVRNIAESAKIQLMRGRLSSLTDGKDVEGGVYRDVLMQSMQDNLHLVEVLSGKSMDIFNGLGYIMDQVSALRKEVRPGAIPELLRALNEKSELQDRNNYMLAKQVCEDCYGTALNDDGAEGGDRFTVR